MPVLAFFALLSCSATEEEADSSQYRAESTRVTRTTDVKQPLFEEGYEEPAAAAPDKPQRIPVERESSPGSGDRRETGRDKASMRDRLPLSAEEEDIIATLQGIKKGKADRSALAADLMEVFPEADEIEMGKVVAARILAATPEYKDRALWEYITFIGLTLVDACPRNGLAFYFIVLDSEEVNAFSAPGGFVFITRGAVGICRNEAELASILAHEVAHISLKHSIRSIDRSKYRFMMKDMLNKMDEASGRDEIAEEIEKELTDLADTLFAETQAPYNRAMEIEADREALVYLTRAGYDPFAAISVMERLDRTTDDPSFILKQFSSHPEPAKRVESMKTAMAELGLKSGGMINEERFGRYTGRR